MEANQNNYNSVSLNCLFKKKQIPKYFARRYTQRKDLKADISPKALREAGLIRGMPSQELSACNKIRKFITGGGLPYGGKALLFGTPTAYTTAKSRKSPYYGGLITDNYDVARDFNSTTGQQEAIYIFIGNSMNPGKAELKANHWEISTCIGRRDVRTGPVNSDTFIEVASAMASSSPDDPVKIVFISSGAWSACPATEKKYPFPMNFEASAKQLILKYSNLYIIAMIINPKHNKQFQVKYLHQNIVKNIE